MGAEQKAQTPPANEAGGSQPHTSRTKGNMMVGKIFEEQKKEFHSIFSSLARYKHRYEVFRDFITVSAISLRNAIHKSQELEEEYLKVINQYEKDDRMRFPELFALVVSMLEHEPRDVLGTLFEELQLTSDDKGQFFTPHPVSELMASMTACDELKKGKPFITLQEPACGAGGMVLAFVKEVIREGHNPSQRLWVQAMDIDRTSALMCYIQLALWNVPAQILVGDTLAFKFHESWYTPAHILGGWQYRIKKHFAEKSPKQEVAQQETVSGPPHTSEYHEPAPMAEATQFDFGF